MEMLEGASEKEKKKMRPHLFDFLITCCTHAVDAAPKRLLWLPLSLLRPKPFSDFTEFILDAAARCGTLFLHVQHSQARYFLFFFSGFAAACLNHTRPYSSSSSSSSRLKYAPLKFCVRSPPQLMLRVSCCTLAERKYPVFKPVRSSFLLRLKSMPFMCTLLRESHPKGCFEMIFLLLFGSHVPFSSGRNPCD